MSFEWVEIGELQAKKNGSIDPSKFLDETFELHSIPSHDKGNAEILTGREIGSSKQIVQENDVMISKIVPHIRRAMVVPKKGDFRQIASGEWIVFRSEKVYPNYLRHLLISDFFNAEFMATVSGVGGSLLRARPAFVSKIKIPLPPLSEQKRIADILDKAEELRQKRQQSIEKLDELLQATFIDMFGDPISNSKGWGIEKLKNNISHANNGLSRRRKEVENLGEIVLRLQDIHYDGIHFNKDLNRILLDESEKKRFKVDEGDILFIRVNGNPEYVGRSAVFNGFNENIYHNDHLIRIKVNEKYNPYFLSYCLNTNSGKRIIAKQLKTSAGQHTISQGGIEMLDFIVPPIGNQNEFVRIRKNIEQQKQLLKIQLNNQENLFQSLQQRAFNGEL